LVTGVQTCALPISTSTAITEATLAGLDSAHSDGGFLHVGNGYYRLDLPDAACASGVVGVLVHGTVTGMVVIGCYIQLVAVDPFDSVRMGLTALPNAAADGAGGLPISDAGGLDLDAKLANTNEVTAARMGALTDWLNGGRLDLILDDILLDVIRPRVEDGLQFLIVLTKADKLTRSEGAAALSVARLQAGGGDAMLFSAPKRIGIDAISQRLWQWAHPPEALQTDAPGAPPAASGQ
jgi:hypothetical protein